MCLQVLAVNENNTLNIDFDPQVPESKVCCSPQADNVDKGSIDNLYLGDALAIDIYYIPIQSIVRPL